MYKTILVTLDGTPTDRAIIEHIKQLAKLTQGRVVLLHVADGWAARTFGPVAIHPQVGGAVQVADYRMEEIEVSEACDDVGKTIESVRGESVIVAVRRTDGRLEPQPEPGAVIEAGDMLVAIGTPGEIGTAS